MCLSQKYIQVLSLQQCLAEMVDGPVEFFHSPERYNLTSVINTSEEMNAIGLEERFSSLLTAVAHPVLSRQSDTTITHVSQKTRPGR